MSKKDLINEYIGIIAIIIIVIVAIIAIYVYVTHHPQDNNDEIGNATISSLIQPPLTKNIRSLT